MKKSRMKKNHAGPGLPTGIPIIALLLITAGLSLLSGCASGAQKYEVPFGTETVVDSFTVSSEKTGEGEFRITIISDAAEELDVDIRMRRTEIGFDYGSNRTALDPYFYTSFNYDTSRKTIRRGEVNIFNAQMENMYQISRYFYTVAYVKIRGEEALWRIDIRIEDENLFTDIRYLRQLNKTDYWHPRMIQENWEEYLNHIGE